MAADTSESDESPANGGQERPSRHSRLPYLTLALLALMAGWFFKHYVIDRPSTAHQLRVESFDKALRLIKKKYPGDVSEEELFRAAMNAVMKRLGGRFSHHLTESERDQLEISTQGNYSGIGATVGQKDGQLVILEVRDGSPADEAGLKPKDRLLSVNGKDITGLPLLRAVSFIRGEVGSTAELTVKRASSGKTEKVTVTRRKIELKTVTGSLEEGGTIGTVTVDRFGNDVSENIRETILSLKKKGAKALILDLRDNPGGLMEEAVRTVDMFLDSGTIISVKKDGLEQVKNASTGTVVPQSWPIVVLVNRWTASAGEIVAGALKYHGRATVVGTRTVGKGEVNKVFSLPNKSALSLTVAHYLAGGEIKVSGQGIKPDVLAGKLPDKDDISPKKRQKIVRRARHEQKEAALRVLREKLNE
jgi:carboxyl-terminal processing protease